MNKGLPKYCKHLYKHNPTSSSWYGRTGNTSLFICPTCKKLYRISKELINKIQMDPTNPEYSRYILGVSITKTAFSYYRELRLNVQLLHKEFPPRCELHAGIKNKGKRRFGSGFTRRQWKKERELNGGKHKSSSYERR